MIFVPLLTKYIPTNEWPRNPVEVEFFNDSEVLFQYSYSLGGLRNVGHTAMVQPKNPFLPPYSHANRHSRTPEGFSENYEKWNNAHGVGS